MAGFVTVRWVTHPELSVVHAAYIVATGAPCVDQKIEQMLIDPVAGINTRLISSSMDVGRFWQRYRSEIAATDNVGGACQAALLAAGCSELQVEQTAKAISSLMSECRLRFNGRFPKLAEQLELRSRPLKDRWDTVGPGLLRAIQMRIGAGDFAWPPRMDGLLVQPMRGGDGGSQPPRRFWIEAVLTDVDAAVPEVLRVAWLIARSAVESQFAQDSSEEVAVRAWALATIPVVLDSADQLQIAAADSQSIRAAVKLWQMGSDPVADRLADWWSKAQPSNLPFAESVLDLDRQLRPAADADDPPDPT